MIDKFHKGGRIGFSFDDLGEISITVPIIAHGVFQVDEDDGGGIFLSRSGINNMIEALKKARDEYDSQFDIEYKKTGGVHKSG